VSRRRSPATSVPTSSLAWLSGQLGGDVLRIETAPAGADEIVRGVVLYDSVVLPAVQPGELILAIGVAPSSGEAEDVLRWAASCGASGVVVKAARKEGAPVPAMLATAAEEAGVALLAIPAEMAWDQLYALVRRLLDTSADWSAQDSGQPLGDVLALADAIAAMVGGPVVIDNPRLQVIAYSNMGGPIDDLRRQSILARSIPEGVMRRFVEEGVLRSIAQSTGTVRLPDWVGTRPRIGVAIRAGKEILGYIFVVEGDTPLGEEAERLLVEASRIAALHLLHLRSSEELEQRIRSDLLRGVLEERGSTERLASQLRIDPTGSFVILAAQRADPDEQVDGSARAGRLRDIVSLQCESVWRHAVAVPVGDRTYAFLPGAEVLPSARVVRLAHELVERAGQSLGLTLDVAVGTTVSHLSLLGRSRRTADQVLQLLRTHLAGRRVALFDDVRPHAFLLELQTLASVRDHVETGKVAALRQYDAVHGSQYLLTLQAYLGCLGDVAVASKQIHVHPNTLRYRLRRLVELAELDLDDPTDRLVAELQMRLL
jgi:sugar diacid utilization regulator